tara:strand:+ start:131 stop:337 length:207 start_codon:yes stop_codon:yes gene_type:complete
MTITNKLIVLICLMVGTAMFINSLNELLYNVGAVYILSYTVSILMFCVGIRLLARAEGDITNGRRRVI